MRVATLLAIVVSVMAFGCDSSEEPASGFNGVGAGAGGAPGAGGASGASGTGGTSGAGTGGAAGMMSMTSGGAGGAGGMSSAAGTGGASGTAGMNAMAGAGGVAGTASGGTGGAGGMGGEGGTAGGGELTCPANCELASEYACICQGVVTSMDMAAPRAHCQTTGLDLATIPNQTVNDAIGAALAARGLPASNDGLVFIGYNDQASEGDFVWFRDGSAVTYFNWGPDQPNDVKINDFVNGEDCGAINGGGFWVDLHCTAAAGFLCN